MKDQFEGSMWHNAHPKPDKKHYDMKPIFELMDDNIKQLENLLPKKQDMEYLSTIQSDMYKAGQRLKAIREANGIELTDIAFRDKAQHIENGQGCDGSMNEIGIKYFFQYLHEIGATIGPHNSKDV